MRGGRLPDLGVARDCLFPLRFILDQGAGGEFSSLTIDTAEEEGPDLWLLRPPAPEFLRHARERLQLIGPAIFARHPHRWSTFQREFRRFSTGAMGILWPEQRGRLRRYGQQPVVGPGAV